VPRSPLIALLALALLGALLWVRLSLVDGPREASLEVRVRGAAQPATAVVRLDLVGEEGHHEAQADARGVARFEDVPPGFYDVTASAGRLETAQAVRVRLSPGRRLEIGIEVVGGGPPR